MVPGLRQAVLEVRLPRRKLKDFPRELVGRHVLLPWESRGSLDCHTSSEDTSTPSSRVTCYMNAVLQQLNNGAGAMTGRLKSQAATAKAERLSEGAGRQARAAPVGIQRLPLLPHFVRGYLDPVQLPLLDGVEISSDEV